MPAARARATPISSSPSRTAWASSTPPPIPLPDLLPDQLLLRPIRTHDQFNTPIYGEAARSRGIHGGRRVIFLNADDIASRGLNPGARVDIPSHFCGRTRTARGFA